MIGQDCICKLRNVYKAINGFETDMEKAMGLNLNEAMLLCLLSDGGMLLSGEIADKLSLTRSNTSKVIASLEEMSFIRRRACKEDSRCQKFHITKRGMEKLEELQSKLTMPEDLASLI